MPIKKPASSPKSKKPAKTLDERKAEALDMIDEGESKKKAKKKVIAKEGSLYSHLGDENAVMPVTTTAAKATVEPEEDEDTDKRVEEVDGQKVVHMKGAIVISELADLMGLKPFNLIRELMTMDVFASAEQTIEPAIAAKLCENNGFVLEQERREKGGGVHKVEEVIEEPELPDPEEVEEDQLKERPPVVTFMGHVDHGKTSLLDHYRGSRIVAGEAGGITQGMGAYQVEKDGKKVTFIDTPGHAAFSEMRARGANVTDIVILVVAADDGLMPTTLEAIDHCRAADVPIIVAINKVDLPRADLNKVKGQLQSKDLAPEDLGGSTLCVEVSAKTGVGLDELFDTINLQAEIMELRANSDGPARAIVIEARSEAGKGPTASVVVQTGTLEQGKPFICGSHYGKIKGLVDDQGNRVDSAGPSTPIEVIGLSGIPNVGDELVEMENERHAKKLGEERQVQLRQQKLQPEEKSALETLFANIEDGQKTVLKLIIKADVQGSLQAIEKSLMEIESDKIKLDIIRQGAGPITEADVLLASASDAILIGFNTKVESKAQVAVKREGVQVKLFSIIYELLDQIKESMLGMLDPETREKILGHAKVLEVFKLSSGRVGGCVVTDGKLVRVARARVLRDKVPIYDGAFSTLRRFKDDVKEVKNGIECGVKLGNFNDYQKDDIIQCYELEKLEVSL
ncbi:MAG: translation initiation factor IF-2 [Verrucomicrobiales bacterium]|nr:translation initiation factor IF-2 [Verrucomicrobiales bacterium]